MGALAPAIAAVATQGSPEFNFALNTEKSTIHNPVLISRWPSNIMVLFNLKSTFNFEYVISYPTSTRSLIDKRDVFKSAKMWACNKCPDGNVRTPMCDEKMVSPFATVTPIREFSVVARTSVKECESLIAT